MWISGEPANGPTYDQAGFPAAYWHDSFEDVASHGYINLSPADAKWLCDWAGLGERVIISAGQ